MPDDFDRSQELQEFFHEMTLKARKATGPNHTGFCHWCGEEVEYPKRWCDADCRTDWERHDDRQK